MIKNHGCKEDDPNVVASCLLLERRQCSEDEQREKQLESKFIYNRVGMMQCDAGLLKGLDEVAVIE